jgi:hypothetical protein
MTLSTNAIQIGQKKYEVKFDSLQEEQNLILKIEGTEEEINEIKKTVYSVAEKALTNFWGLKRSGSIQMDSDHIRVPRKPFYYHFIVSGSIQQKEKFLKTLGINPS